MRCNTSRFCCFVITLAVSDATFGGPHNPDSNAEIIAILRATDISGKSYNKDGIRNPQKQNFLTGPRPARDTASPGIDRNGVYRDPWGDPYHLYGSELQPARSR